MLDGIPTEQKASAAGGLALLGIIALRWLGMRISKDAITLKADSADLDAFTRLQDRVDRMDHHINELEAARNNLFGFVAKCMAYISQCQCQGVSPPTKGELQADYVELIKSLTRKDGGK